MSDEREKLVERLMRVGERIATPCPDGIKGCAVLHYRVETDPACKEAADQIEADGKRIAELTDLLCLADELLMEAKGAFPLPGNPLRSQYLLIREVTGADYNNRKNRARAALNKEPSND